MMVYNVHSFLSQMRFIYNLNPTVGFHRYILPNFNGDTSNGLVEQEVKEFDPPSEVSERKHFLIILLLSLVLKMSFYRSERQLRASSFPCELMLKDLECLLLQIG